MLCKRCGKNNALVEDGLCARCADEAFGSLTPAPGDEETGKAGKSGETGEGGEGGDAGEAGEGARTAEDGEAGNAGQVRKGDAGRVPLPPPLPSAPYDPAARWALLRSPNRLAALAVALLGLVIVVDLCAVAAGFAEYRLVADLAGGDWSGYDDGEAERLDDLYALSGQAQVGALVVTAIGFIAWFLRVRDNAHVIAPFGQSKARPWAIFGFFVPIVAFWFPRRIALDTWHASADGLELSRKQAWSGVIELWWFLWLANQLLGRIVSRGYEEAEALPAVRSAIAWVIAGDVLDIVSAAAAILFVRSLTRLQNRKVAAGPHPVTSAQ
ncbi:DUF4328 domain-containing protein [Streptomyces kunmingensis]|uniref:DUF4328 domain-containing protein n=1 Tax=Streptomyces kunmingensis TaxID=68225 RepID=A0ABU6CQN7_9ACTN|nr:DUF4328 domain-containing protein [Streptomyces kunmingensis]MEB3966987.1 DUF4328 domain-containing protein [Streptomyces kunmingensis]